MDAKQDGWKKAAMIAIVPVAIGTVGVIFPATPLAAAAVLLLPGIMVVALISMLFRSIHDFGPLIYLAPPISFLLYAALLKIFFDQKQRRRAESV